MQQQSKQDTQCSMCSVTRKKIRQMSKKLHWFLLLFMPPRRQNIPNMRLKGVDAKRGLFRRGSQEVLFAT